MRVQDYKVAPSAVRSFSVQVPDYFNWGFDVIDRWGRETPNNTALIHLDEGGKQQTLTFRDVSEKSSQLANFVARNGVRKGRPVLLMLPNTPILWLSIVALIKRGAIIVPCAPTLTEKDLEYRVSAAGIKGIITDGDNLQKFAEATQGHREQLKFLAYSSDNECER